MINSTESSPLLKKSRFKNWMIITLVFCLILLVCLGFGIAIMTIISLQKLSSTLESYSELAVLVRQFVFKGQIVVDNVIGELPHIDLILNKVVKIIDWVCSNYPDLKCT